MDEEAPRPKPALLTPPVLDRVDVDELRAYVAALRGEITRAEAEIARKQGLRAAADSFFRSP